MIKVIINTQSGKNIEAENVEFVSDFSTTAFVERISPKDSIDRLRVSMAGSGHNVLDWKNKLKDEIIVSIEVYREGDPVDVFTGYSRLYNVYKEITSNFNRLDLVFLSEEDAAKFPE